MTGDSGGGWKILWRGSLLPLGREAAPNPACALGQADRVCRFCVGCADEREQAPSPQEWVRGSGIALATGMGQTIGKLLKSTELASWLSIRLIKP